ncbi:MAG: SDR family NAD(P)-dependent oxidoreductase [Burkholderiales bacterium]|nr:SDR family NAD(P)-dependent oxidoreductase [Burkholderiales bacterium]
MDLQLDGKRALVTGASRGIGKAIALALAQEGVDVVIAARNLEPLTATALELAAATGRRIVPLVVDTGDDASVKALVETAIHELDGIDILVNNAATPGGPHRPRPSPRPTAQRCSTTSTSRSPATCAPPRRWRRISPPPVGAASSTSAAWRPAAPATTSPRSVMSPSRP